MTKQIMISVTTPIDCTEEQFDEWVQFTLGVTASMSVDNPLHEYDLEGVEITSMF